VLLVDDEPNVVQGLQRFLRRYRDTWEVSTANSGRAALAIMETATFDVIVTDMRMPEMDGAAFLAVAKARSPATMRIVLSGQTDAAAALRALPVAHQFLSKPTDPAVLFAQLQRLAATHDVIADPRVRAAMGAIETLPSAAGTYHELNELLANERASLDAVARVVETEPAVVLKMLQLVNSAFFGVTRRIVGVSDAVSYLGLDLVRSLILSAGVANGLPVRATSFDASAFEAHALAVARMARVIDATGERAHVSFVAALLHDIGKLVLASTLPEELDGIVARAVASGHAVDVEERATLGCGHTQVGAALVDLWGLPYPIVEAILSFEEAPSTCTGVLRPADVIQLAHRLVASPADALDAPEDLAWLARLGISAEQRAAWRAQAERLRGPS
jgi:HD-like signal output (HDOD) protein/CheY-like chemotaxis protein